MQNTFLVQTFVLHFIKFISFKCIKIPINVSRGAGQKRPKNIAASRAARARKDLSK